VASFLRDELASRSFIINDFGGDTIDLRTDPRYCDASGSGMIVFLDDKLGLRCQSDVQFIDYADPTLFEKLCRWINFIPVRLAQESYGPGCFHVKLSKRRRGEAS